jgi:ABC-type molybdenum transport system ATPase subunit/photorepair protein PhrA
VYLLNGEVLPGSTVPALGTNLSTEADGSLVWQLTFGQSTVSFPEASFPRYTASSSITYRHPQQDSRLASPTLLVGDNGVGKSVFAKILAGLLRPDGEIRVACGGSRGPARLILQDALPQLFGRSTNEYLQTVFRYDDKGREEAIELYRSLEDAVRAEVVAQPSIRQDAVGNQEHPDSVLQARLALIAERLVSRPPLLILDEPGWCLSMPLARALLHAACIEARRRHVGLIVISHLDSWWDGLDS